MKLEFEILKDHEDFVAINKPSGWAVHKSKLVGNTPVVLQVLRDQLDCYLYPVHRLDQGTSGILIFAKSSEAASIFSMQIRGRLWDKTYQCLVRGWPKDSFSCNKPLRKAKDKEEKEAETDFNLLNKFEIPFGVGKFPTTRLSLIEATPKSGIYHQIRRHLNHLANPIVGDRMHGDNKINHLLTDHFSNKRLLLHASGLRFEWKKKDIQIECPISNEFKAVVAKIESSNILSNKVE